MALLPSILRKAGVRSTAHSQLVLDGRTIDVTLRPNARAKRIILRLNKHGKGIVLTVPTGTSHSKAMEFAASQGVWIWQQLAKQPDHVAFEVDQVIPVRDIPHLVIRQEGRRKAVCDIQQDNGDWQLMVSGDANHHPRRIADWLKKQARNDLTNSAHYYAEQMNLKISRISVRDTSTRWGSCSSTGSLSFSWRLIFAPSFVLDYVAAHEVAHLQEMNHSSQFWNLVEHHCSATGKAKSWLKTNGRSLHRYGS